MQKEKQNEKNERFLHRLKALGAKCRLGTAEEDLIKDIFIAFMSNTDIQRELLMETRNPLQILHFALNLERGQENQKAINTHLNRATALPLNQISYIQRNQTPSQTPRWRIPTRNPQPQCNAILPIHAYSADYSSPQNKYARLKESSATYAKKSDTTAKWAAQPNFCGRPNK